ncbi:hypothetical protein MACH17_28460 [Phaeobacter inhibens]|uniref:hypothetical protein n=1 Tax=Phaeobacter inhibens TaxID=221822 RepID=UPI002749C216|nr:hypothetical protein [Phaeobacter inhibens]GLO71329.1 hypothetical protein MACH17_28460 [Phaeobacter inhibens]
MEDGLSEDEHAAQVAARQRVDFADQQHEVAGLETGRRARFLGGQTGHAAQLKKDRDERAFRDVLEMLLQDPEYRALYEELGETLGAAEQNADGVIADLEAELADLQRDLDQMLEAAPCLPNGARVFRFGDGRVMDELGQEVAPEIAEGIIWPPDAPSAEAYLANRDRQVALNDLLEQWQGYRNDTLGGIRDRYDDRDDPMDKDDLRDAIEQVQDATPRLSTVNIPSEHHDNQRFESALTQPVPSTLR